MNKTLIKWLLIVAIVLGTTYYRFNGHNVPQVKTDREIKLEKWTKIGEYKLDIDDLDSQRQQKLEMKEKLLQEFNGTGEGFIK